MATNRIDISKVWASSASAGAILDPGTAKYLQGWQAEIPPYQYMNYIQNRLDNNLKALAERGVFEWGSDVDYQVGAIAWDEDTDRIYYAKVSSPNTALKPSDNLAQWDLSVVQEGKSILDALQAVLDAHEADKTNPHEVTAYQAGSYTVSDIDALVAEVGLAIELHEQDFNNPHKVTAAQVGAVPVTGGRYLGKVDFAAQLMEVSKGSGGVTKHLDGRNGMFLTVDSYSVGLNSAGIAVWKDGATEHDLLLEEDFVALKLANEQKYSVPRPDFWLPLVNDIHIREGVGTSEYSDTPTFDSDGLLSAGGETFTTVLDLPNTQEASLHFYMKCTAYSFDYALTLGGFFGTNIELSGEAEIALIGGGMQSMGLSLGVVGQGAFITITRNSSGLYKSYFNGVLLDTATSNPTAHGNPTLTSESVAMHLKAMKAWGVELTAEQVSTLR